MFITKKHLNRRTVLRGAGVSVALPLLDAMVPAATALAATAAAPKPRMAFVYFPHGAVMQHWSPVNQVCMAIDQTRRDQRAAEIHFMRDGPAHRIGQLCQAADPGQPVRLHQQRAIVDQAPVGVVRQRGQTGISPESRSCHGVIVPA